MKTKLKYHALGMIFLIILAGCKTKRAITEAGDYAAMEKIVDSRNFQVTQNWAIPLRGNQINLIGNQNYIRFSKDSVALFLPYFGVRQMGGGYNAVAGFEYQGLLKEFKVDKNSDEHSIEINFETSQKTENLNYTLTLFSGGNSRLRVISTQRDNISYTGFFEATKNDKRKI